MLRALIVDDHEVVRLGLRVMLAKAFSAMTIAEARDSQEAVELLIKTKWSIILLDISMPGRSGLDLMQDCKRLNPRTPF